MENKPTLTIEKGELVITSENSHFNASQLKAIQSIPEHMKSFVLAKNEPKLTDYGEPQTLLAIALLIGRSIELSGESKKYGSDTVVIGNVSKRIYDYCADKYKGMTMKELSKAFEAGISNEYGEWVGFGVATFTKFIKGYMTSAKREAAMKEWMKAQDQVLITDRPIGDLFKPNLDLTIELFEIFKENPKLVNGNVYSTDNRVFHLPAIYNFLVDNFVINISSETKALVIETAKRNYWEFVKSGILKNDVENGKLTKLIESVKNDTNRTMDNFRDAEGLRVLFTKLIERGKTINDLKRIN